MLPPRAYKFIFLNIIRVLSIIALILAFSSNVVTLANDWKTYNRFLADGKQDQSGSDSGSSNSTVVQQVNMDYILGSTVPNQGFGIGWAIGNRFFIILQIFILFLSEIQFGWITKKFDQLFPVLGSTFGTAPLGAAQALIGAAILSHHVDTFTLVSACFLFSVGCINLLIVGWFGAAARATRSLTSWKEHAKGVLPTHVGPVNIQPMTSSILSGKPPSFVSNLRTGSSDSSEKGGFLSKEKMASLGFGRQGEKAAALRGYTISKPVESLPRYMSKPAPI